MLASNPFLTHDFYICVFIDVCCTWWRPETGISMLCNLSWGHNYIVHLLHTGSANEVATKVMFFIRRQPVHYWATRYSKYKLNFINWSSLQVLRPIVKLYSFQISAQYLNLLWRYFSLKMFRNFIGGHGNSNSIPINAAAPRGLPSTNFYPGLTFKRWQGS